MRIEFKNDKYRGRRGGYSRLLKISCEHCKKYLFYYQKDGPGILKRLYIDRIFKSGEVKLGKNLICPECKRILGISTVYKKENRPALRLFVGAITKKIVRTN